MNKSFYLIPTLLIFFVNCYSQNCNNWLYNPTVNSTFSIGDLDVPGNQITVEATINRTVPYKPQGLIISEGDVVSKHNSPADVNYLLRPNYASITTSDGFFYTPSACDIEINKTYHIAMVYNGSTLKYYRNGFLLSEVAATGSLIQNDWNTKFGLYDPAYWKSQFIGYINEVRIWNVARSQTQLKTYMNAVLPSPSTQVGLLGYYSFDNLINKQGNTKFNGILNGDATINATNTNCAFFVDSCSISVKTPQNNIGDIINTYTPITDLNLCNNEIKVKDPSTFNIGDTVLLIQMKGAIIDTSNSASFGTVTDYRNAGNYEFNCIKNKLGNTLELKNNLTNNYDVQTGKVQLIRVPYFDTANITSTLTCLPWDGEKGGVLVLNAKERVNLYAHIDLSGKGFYGGKVDNPKSNLFYCHENEYYYPKDPIKAAPKGEGIADISISKSFGKGAIANGGGGGLEHNSGGGGGSNAGTGGVGGNEWITCGPPVVNGGLGGKSLNYSNTLNKIFLGGGGGGGHSDNLPGFNPDGGNGGGIILIQTSSFKANSFSILANGANGIECYKDNQAFKCHEGMGGGGGGGAVLLRSNIYLDNLIIEVKGGKGADMNGEIAGKLGPGGGGGGGISWFSDNTIPSNVVITKKGGISGVNIDFGNDNFGATSGQDGNTVLNLMIPNDTIPFTKNIDSTLIKNSFFSCNTVQFNGLSYIKKYPIITWLWNFGDNTTDTGKDIKHVFKKDGTYKISLLVTDSYGCKDSTTKTITTLGAGTQDFSYKQDICDPLTVQFISIDANTINSFWLFGDGSSVKGVIDPTHVYAKPGNYTVRNSASNGSCADTITKNIVVDIKKDDIILTQDTTICYGSSKQLLTTPALLDFCWSPKTYLSDANSPNPTTNTTVPITYYITASIPGNNIITNGDFSAGNTGFTSLYDYATPNITEGQYFVGPSSQAWNALLSNCSDHTTGVGNMLMVNGASVPDVAIWKQDVTVLPNTNYAFSTWIESLYQPNPAQLSFSINGNNIGNIITASQPNCNWTQFYTTWNSGNITSASIAIVNKNTAVQGNDFALDDISFAPIQVKTDSVVLTIITPQVKSVTDTIICAGQPVQLTSTGAATYKWYPPIRLSNADISNPIATPLNTTQYIVTGTDMKGCTANDSITIFTKPLPIINKTSDTTICQNVTAQLWATGGTSYNWSPAKSLNDSNLANPIASPKINTTYNVIVTGANNCTAVDSVKVIMRPAIIFTVSSPDTTCFNNTFQLNASGGDTYLWKPKALVSNADIANPLSATNVDAAYSVFISERTCNTSTTLNTSLKVFPLPIITVNKSNDISCVFNTTTLSAYGATKFSWAPIATLTNNNLRNSIASPEITTQYTVTGTDEKTKCTATSSITVLVTKDGEPKFFIPSAFSPNGDGKNDCFKLTHFNYLKSIEVSIYNRFGGLVFHTTNENNCWDGMYKGNPSAAGNYIYYIKTANNCASFVKKGSLILIR